MSAEPVIPATAAVANERPDGHRGVLPDRLSEDPLTRVKDAEGSPGELTHLLAYWSRRSGDSWNETDDSAVYRHLSRRLLSLGAAPQAKEVARAGLEVGASRGEAADSELMQTLGLAQARTNNLESARGILLSVRATGESSEETLGILARTYKDEAERVWDCRERREGPLREALAVYREAYDRFGGFWSGINIATLQSLLNEIPAARRDAEQVERECRADLERLEGVARTSAAHSPPFSPYWHVATLAEAQLIQGRIEEAGATYQQAAGINRRGFGDLKSTRRHARWLLQLACERGEWSGDVSECLDAWLPPPIVVVFAGHMLDRLDRARPRFPAARGAEVAALIREALPPGRSLIGYSAAACGGDLLFQDAVRALGGESRIVLPFDTASFRRNCVEFAGPEWTSLFDRIVDGATLVVEASDQLHPDHGTTFEYGNRVLHGLAALRAAELDAPLRCVALWDGKPGDGRGGTADMVRHWTAAGLEIDRVPLADPGDAALDDTAHGNTEPRRREGAASVSGAPRGAAVPAAPVESPEESPVQIRSMLFGDAVHFSQLSEGQIPLFLDHFLGPIGEILRGYSEENLFRNTWGDGIFLVFRSVRAAGLCALEIAEFVNRGAAGEWERIGLPAALNLRIALHAGPVLAGRDPITGQTNYNGAHVSRAARLEPKTPPGEVYASESFAAICAAERVTDFECQYVKQLDWAKHYGTFPTYVLHRRN